MKEFERLRGKVPVAMRCWLYYYFLNGLVTIAYIGCNPIIIIWNLFQKEFGSMQKLRLRSNDCPYAIGEGGWHFSYLGEIEGI